MIWWFALGYFASYVPYSTLVKASTDGLLAGGQVDGTALLPVSAMSSMVAMALTITGLRWWRFAGFRVWTFLSGLCTAVVILTTTLAYTFHGVSIVFMMLLLRGGVLIMAPLVDALSGRHVRWFSWTALALSLASLLVGFGGRGGFNLSVAAIIDVAAYLGAYFVRLRFMSRMAKSDDPDASRRYFVEEQIVATPAAVLALTVIAVTGVGPAEPIREGFAMLGGHELLGTVVIIGLFSQGTGIFGGLVLLDRRENSFCVPVNRASSMLAGLAATLVLAGIWGKRMPASSELVAAGLVVAAILVLSLPGVVKARRARARAAPPRR